MTPEYQAWAIPEGPPRENAYITSLRMDLSRIKQSLERARHRNHKQMLKSALRDVQARIDRATTRER